MNWLANLSGKCNGFKEMDLLQEHQNFWVKVNIHRSIFGLPLLIVLRSFTMRKVQIELGRGFQ
jgi:hypothetical protein